MVRGEYRAKEAPICWFFKKIVQFVLRGTTVQWIYQRSHLNNWASPVHIMPLCLILNKPATSRRWSLRLLRIINTRMLWRYQTKGWRYQTKGCLSWFAGASHPMVKVFYIVWTKFQCTLLQFVGTYSTHIKQHVRIPMILVHNQYQCGCVLLYYYY